MGVDRGVPYADSHLRAVTARLADPNYLPFMHLGEFEASADTDTSISPSAFEHAQRVLAENTLALASPFPRADVVEVGCGFGGNLAALCNKYELCRVAGLDIHPGQIEIAKQIVSRYAGPGMDLRVGDAIQMPWTNQSFDIVLAIECAFHFASRLAFAREAVRVLRPGGRLVLTDIVTREPEALGAESWLKTVLQTELDPVPDLLCSEGDWATIAASVGFIEAHREDISRAVAPSFQFILKDKPRDIHLLHDRNDRGAFALATAMERGWLHLERWAFVAPS